jgi:1-phosphatidylinositol-4-phosphate 5-kinase
MPHTNSIPVSNRNTTSIESARRHSVGQQMNRAGASNPTVQRNENDAIKGERKGENESDRPDPRLISTIRSPSAERSGGLQGQTLPVVEEMGEASSTGGRSGRSRERDETLDGDYRPLTPAKDNADGRPVTPAKDYSPSINGAMRQPISRSSLDKELPPLPKVASPGEMNEGESILS